MKFLAATALALILTTAAQAASLVIPPIECNG
jgi:opacity protein-like surface antigen